MTGYTESGLIGRPSLVTADKGMLVLEQLATSVGGHLNRLTDTH
jgi:creatinine amidohydrolase